MRPLAILTAAAIMTATLATPSFTQAETAIQERSEQFLVSIDFEGGSLASFVSGLREAAGDMPVNILFQPEFAELQLPPIELEKVDIYSALRVVSSMSEVRPAEMPDGREATWEVQPLGSTGAPVFMISVWAEEIIDEDQEPERYYKRFTMVHSLAGLIAGEHSLGADAVLSSIEIALEMVDQGDADLRFHEDTGLLFARVTEAQHLAIEQTVGRLTESAADFRRANAQSELDRFLKRLGVESAEGALLKITQGREAEKSAEQMRQELSDMERSLRAEFDASQRRLMQMEQEIASLHTQLREARTIAEELERQNQRLESERDALRAQLTVRQPEQDPRQ